MWLERIAAPSTSPVSLEDAKAHLRVTHSADDAYIGALLTLAEQHLDGRRGYLGRALVSQQWEYRIHGFPDCGVIELPLPPLISVESVKYIDDAGAEQTLATDQYVVDTATYQGQVRRAYDVTWPVPRLEDYAVRIRFTAGFGTAASDVPEPVRHAIKMMVGHWYQNRQEATDTALAETPMASKWLLSPYRIQSF